MPVKRARLNRLEQCINDTERDLGNVDNIWEIESFLADYKSSSENEDNGTTSEEEEGTESEYSSDEDEEE